jgi:hypothetical protein
MCNDCECALEYLCSARGFMAYGSCCEKCIGFDEEHSCSAFKVGVPKVNLQTAKVFKTRSKKSIKLYP